MISNCRLIIHAKSYLYIKACASFISKVLSEKFEDSFSMHIVSDVSEVDLSRTKYVFIIGELFNGFVKNKNSYYCFINFSLLYELDSTKNSLSEGGRKWVEKKHELFMSKLHCYDMVLDYLPTQTSIMQDKLSKYSIVVSSFMLNTLHHEKFLKIPFEDRKYDVCVVGSVTNRRESIYSSLSLNKVTLSPFKSESLSEVMRNSRVILNVHAYKSDNIELPRIIEALKLGSCLLTEKSPGLPDIIDSKCYRQEVFGDLESSCIELLSNLQTSNQYGEHASEFMNTDYDALAYSSWKDLLNEF